jgi:DNA replication protein DnaC
MTITPSFDREKLRVIMEGARAQHAAERIPTLKRSPAPRSPLVDRSIPDLKPIKCQHCKDMGFVLQESMRTGQQTVLTCDAEGCTKGAEMRARKYRAVMRYSNLTPIMERMTFASYKPGNNQRAYALARGFAHKLEGWLVLWGLTGTGKTHLLAGIAHELIAQGRHPLFAVVPQLLSSLKAVLKEDDFPDRFNRILNYDIVLLDDLGAELGSPWEETALFTLLNQRVAYCLPTVISSNIPPDLMDCRIASRLQDEALSVVVEMQGEDYRLSKGRRAERTQLLGVKQS